jgi:hypothetical protein
MIDENKIVENVVDTKLYKDVCEMWGILNEAKENFLFFKYLTIPKSEEEKQFINNSLHFSFIRKTLLRMCIVDIFKLYNANDYYSILNFTQRARQNVYYQISDIEILSEVFVETRKCRRIIQNIVSIRNKSLAHKDPKFIYTKFKFEVDEMEQLLNSTEKILYGVFTKCLDTTPVFRSIFFDSAPFDHISKLVLLNKLYAKLENDLSN